MSMTVDEILANFSGKDELLCGLDTAIKSIRPGAAWDLSVSGGVYTFLSWRDPEGRPVPTKEEIDKELDFQRRIGVYYQYVFDRCKEYPDGFEQLDMIWHAVNNGVDLKDSEWFKVIKEIKEKYPKSEGEIPTKE